MLAGSSRDPMETAGLDPKFQDEHVLESQYMSAWRMLFWDMRYLLDIAWWPRMETRTVYLPRDFVEGMRADAMKSLEEAARQNPDGATSHPPYVSDGDVVSAWLACMAAKELPPRSTRSAVIMTPINIRDRVPSIFPAKKGEGVYVLNAAPILSTIVKGQDMLSGNDHIGKVAQALRRALMTQTSERQIHALNRLERLSIAENGLPALFGDPSNFLIILTNTTKARFVENVDSGPAVIKAHVDHDTTKTPEPLNRSSFQSMRPGQMVYYHVQRLAEEKIFARNTFFLFETPAGEYWINGSLPPAIWGKMEECFRALRSKL